VLVGRGGPLRVQRARADVELREGSQRPAKLAWCVFSWWSLGVVCQKAWRACAERWLAVSDQQSALERVIESINTCKSNTATIWKRLRDKTQSHTHTHRPIASLEHCSEPTQTMLAHNSEHARGMLGACSEHRYAEPLTSPTYQWGYLVCSLRRRSSSRCHASSSIGLASTSASHAASDACCAAL
jgi:hypothetical protein